jgi:hypothetical protein
MQAKQYDDISSYSGVYVIVYMFIIHQTVLAKDDPRMYRKVL